MGGLPGATAAEAHLALWEVSVLFKFSIGVRSGEREGFPLKTYPRLHLTTQPLSEGGRQGALPRPLLRGRVRDDQHSATLSEQSAGVSRLRRGVGNCTLGHSEHRHGLDVAWETARGLADQFSRVGHGCGHQAEEGHGRAAR